jgi:hypothetical protein
MYPVHPIIALDLARDRSRTLAAQAVRDRLAAGAASGSPKDPRPGMRVRRRVAAGLRVASSTAVRFAGTAGQAAARLDGDAV